MDPTTISPHVWRLIRKYVSENAPAPSEHEKHHEKKETLEIIELMYQFTHILQKSAAFHGNLNARLVKAKLDMKQAQWQLRESKKATPMACE